MMQRLKLLNSPYSFACTWVGATLHATRSKHGGGWDVRFPQLVGNFTDSDDGAKNTWFHADKRVLLLDPIPYEDKPHYTLVPSRIQKGTKVWAKMFPITRRNALDCHGCAFNKDLDNCKLAPPCSSVTRWDGKDVIFITAVEQW